jgi:hypothetical protein
MNGMCVANGGAGTSGLFAMSGSKSERSQILSESHRWAALPG